MIRYESFRQFSTFVHKSPTQCTLNFLIPFTRAARTKPAQRMAIRHMAQAHPLLFLHGKSLGDRELGLRVLGVRVLGVKVLGARVLGVRVLGCRV